MSKINTAIYSGVTLVTSGKYGSPLTVTASGTVEPASGIAIYGPGSAAGTNSWTVDNFGLISGGGTAAAGVGIQFGSSSTNSATGNLVTNESGGRIYGALLGVAIYGDGTVVNSGSIAGAIGVKIVGTGGAGGTIIDSGTIAGASGTAVYFGGSASNLLELLPGYALGGTVLGRTAGGAVHALELGSGASAGTVSTSLQTEFLHFTRFAVDAGARWTLSGNSTIGLGGSLTDLGTLTNAGSLGATNATFAVNAGTLVNSGTIAAALTWTGGGYMANHASAVLTAAKTGISSTGGTLTLVNAGTISDTGTTGSGVSLSSGSINNSGLILGGIGATASAVSNSGTIVGSTGVALTAGFINNSGSIQGLVYESAVSTIINTGRITATRTRDAGVYLHQGGVITNTGTGALIRGAYGMVAGFGYGTVVNSGTISGTNGSGIYLYWGGTVVNSGTILSLGTSHTVLFQRGYLSNSQSGYIGSGGVDFFTGIAGTVVNAGRIVDTNGPGVTLFFGGTVVDSGTISGKGTAISFGGTGFSRLVLEAGYQLNGKVSVAGTYNTLELLGATGVVSVNFNKASAGFTNFGTVAFGAPSGNIEVLEISGTASPAATITDFTDSRDAVDLIGLAGGTMLNGGTVNASNQLVVGNGTSTMTLQLDPNGDYIGLAWRATTDGAGGTDVSPVCYCRGTRVLTDKGEVAIEELAIGDRLVTFSGVPRPVKWVGHRAYDGRLIAGNREMLPVRITAGALADRAPARDLRVSPEHSLYVDGVLVAARQLINGATIVQEEAVDQVEYFHVELETHDIIVADGVAAESYVDCDNRGRFHNAAEFALLYPDDERPHAQFYAPRVEWDSDAPNAIRAALLQRAAALGHRLDSDPDLHLIVDGVAVRPASIDGRRYRFTLPAGSRAASLASRSAVPAEIRAEARDMRRLGVPVVRVVLYDRTLRIEAEHGDPGLSVGFHADEASHRWTDGCAPLPDAWIAAFSGAITLEVYLIDAGLPYRLPAAAPSRAA